MEYDNAWESLCEHLRDSTHILALIGAGLSASSGIPTFSGAGAYWRGHESKSLATPSAFAKNPSLVWQFYEDRRQRAFAALPNRGHAALAELARLKPAFLAISQNIDNLSQRAGHPADQLAPLHGSLFTAKCFDADCGFVMSNSDVRPIVPSLYMPPDVEDASVLLPSIENFDLPQCPQCRTSLLRPGVVLFGEPLPTQSLEQIEKWFDSIPRIDLMLVIGTAARVFPAAEYISKARDRGAAVAVFDIIHDDELLEEDDWFIGGDVAETLPALLGQSLGVYV